MSTRAIKMASTAYPATSTVTAAGSLYITHGLLGSAQNWASPASKLAKAPELQGCLNQVVALDMRNHGLSPHTVNHTNAALASDLEAAIIHGQHALHRRLGSQGDRHAATAGSSITGKASVVMGHSMGGLATMGMLLRRYNETSLLPEDPFEASDSFSEAFGPTWGTEHRSATSEAMRNVNCDFDFAATQPIRDILFSDTNLSKRDCEATGPVAGRIPKLGRVSAGIIVDICPTTLNGSHATRDGNDDDIKKTLEAMTRARLERMRTYSEAAKELEAAGVTEKQMRDFVLTNLVIDAKGEQPTRWKCNLADLLSQYGMFKPSIVSWYLDAVKRSGGGGGDNDTNGSDNKFVAPNPCTLPMLFVFGGSSPYNVASQRDRIGQFFPNARQVEIAGAGHFVHHEKQKEFLAAVVPFIAEHMA